jgi:hypothetical protein
VTGDSLLTRSPRTLGKLPLDIILIIFEILEELYDVTMLALTSSTFWIVGQRRLCAVRDQCAMRWAGCRISLIGEYSFYTRPVMNDDVVEELKMWTATHCEGYTGNPRRYLYAFLTHAFRRVKYPHLELPRKFRPESVESRVLKALLEAPLPPSPVFRNLTSREYICEDKEMLRRLGTDDAVFGQVLLARMCWSSDSSTLMAYTGPLHYGKWAGDQVDCVDYHDFKREMAGKKEKYPYEEPWTDITVEAWGLLVDIYRAADTNR